MTGQLIPDGFRRRHRQQHAVLLGRRERVPGERRAPVELRLERQPLQQPPLVPDPQRLQRRKRRDRQTSCSGENNGTVDR
jgi:hypothetical protein